MDGSGAPRTDRHPLQLEEDGGLGVVVLDRLGIGLDDLRSELDAQLHNAGSA